MSEEHNSNYEQQTEASINEAFKKVVGLVEGEVEKNRLNNSPSVLSDELINQLALLIKRIIAEYEKKKALGKNDELESFIGLHDYLWSKLFNFNKDDAEFQNRTAKVPKIEL